MGRLVEYPYIHPEGRIDYVPLDDPFMQMARDTAQLHSLDTHMPNASVIAIGDTVLGLGANGSSYHQKHGCERVRQHVPTGQGYELCDGCHPKNHSEQKAIDNTLAAGHDPVGASLTLYGHWWCCESCWSKMVTHGIRIVRLPERSEVLFNRDKAENIIGKQFEATAARR